MGKYRSEIEKDLNKLKNLKMVIKDEFEQSTEQLTQISEIQKAFNSGGS